MKYDMASEKDAGAIVKARAKIFNKHEGEYL